MKRTLLLLAGALLCGNLHAQKTAKDWTRPACNGISHHLYGELDSQYVVVLEFVMMDCSPCVTAANGLKEVVIPFHSSHPGRVKLYSIGYSDTYTCEDLRDWQGFNGFTHPVFAGGQSEVAYYGGMGMPTIVVVANDSHHVFYKKQGYASSHKQAITNAINQALGLTSGMHEDNIDDVRVFPNPVNEKLFLDLPETPGKKQAVISDINGRQVLTASFFDGKAITVRGLRTGIYILDLYNEGILLGRTRFVKTE